ncbi:hypothetical protein BGY98DRAFT_982623 [Russula aff. rugulosa BPL654]|nr:hypothetical protein BGY98DRAFT_982623 [Russula aff. rugulosa BPL654]
MVFVHTLRVRRSLMSFVHDTTHAGGGACSSSNVLLVARAFKLEDGHFGQLTYQGSLKKGQFTFHRRPGKRINVPSWCRVYASFSSGLTFVTLSQVKALDSIIIVDKVDYSRVQKLGRKHIQYFLIIMHTLRSRPLVCDLT